VPGGQQGIGAADRTAHGGLIARDPFGDQQRGAMVTIPRAIADAGHTVGTDRMQVQFMEREIRAAMVAALGVLFAGGSARRAAHHVRLVALRLKHRYHRPATATEAVARPLAAGIVLPFALLTCDDPTHRIPPLATRARDQTQPSPVRAL